MCAAIVTLIAALPVAAFQPTQRQKPPARAVVLPAQPAAPIRGVPVIRGGRQRAGVRKPLPRGPQVLIEPSAPIANLFARAEEGIKRSDWKFTIDCYQRIIDSEESSLVTDEAAEASGDIVYESARRRALRRLSSLPPEAHRAYRLLYDGRAKRLLSRGRDKHDAAALRSILGRYLLSRHSVAAADLLSSWALDAGRPGEALMILEELLEFSPDLGQFDLHVRAKLAAAYAMLGRADEARAMLARTNHKNLSASDDAVDVVSEALSLEPIEYDEIIGQRSWPVLGGSLDRRGLMTSVKPTLVEPIPWRYRLSQSGSTSGRRVFSNNIGIPLTLPVGRLVSDGTHLFVRTRVGCVALQAEDLSLVWSVEDDPTLHVAARPVQSRNRFGQRQQQRGARNADPAYDDYVVGGIGLAHDMVFSVTRAGGGAYTLGDRDAGGSWRLLPRLAARRGAARRHGLRLIARDAISGHIRWERGRTSDGDDPLGDVKFRAIPVVIGDELWVPFQKQNDLYVGVLNPRDGAVVRKILLGSLRESQQRSPVSLSGALSVAVANGLVYVPTGRGVLFAVDANNYTLRWASQYRCDDAGVGGTSKMSQGWLSSPPIATRGLVLLLPEEYNELLAISEASGAILWSAPREDGAYLIGADSKHVWIGGRTLRCVDIGSGEVVWKSELVAAPTGRAVLSGDTIYAPSLDGLLTFEATSGAPGETIASPDVDDPLGNVLCLDQAMFVVTPASVRKFPDLAQIYPATVALHEEQPGNVAVAIRLAWLELLRGDPQRAYDALDRVKEVLDADGDTQESLAHARVEVLLTLARQATEHGRVGEDVLAYLDQATESASNGADRLRCGVAVATQLNEMGRGVEAYRRLWQIGVSADANQTIPIGERVVGAARLDIARRLGVIADGLSADEQWAMSQFAEDQVTTIAKRLALPDAATKAASDLLAVAELESSGRVSMYARLALARYHRRQARYESAEQLLEEIALAGRSDADTVRAMVELCSLYLDADAAGIASESVLAKLLDDLDSEYGFAALPGGVDTSEKAVGSGVLPTTVGEWVDRVRLHRHIAVKASRSSSGRSVPLQFTGELAWHRDWDFRSTPIPTESSPRLVTFDRSAHAPRAAALAGRVVLQGPDDVVHCLRASDGELLWKTTLRLPGQFSDRRITGGDMGLSPRHAVVSGQTAVFSGANGLFAVGLATGRRLWARAYKADASDDVPADGDLLLSADKGRIAAMPTLGKLALMRLRDGTTVWERDMRGEQVAQIRLIGDRVVTVDAGMRRVHVYDRSDGSLIRRVLFQQPQPSGTPTGLVFSGDVVCAPTGVRAAKTVSGVSLETGETLWNVTFDNPLGHLFRPMDGYVGISTLSGGVRILDATTGEVVLDRVVRQAHVVIDGTMVDGMLLVQYILSANDPRRQRFAALDIATGDELWRSDELSPVAIEGLAPQIVDGYLPVYHWRAKASPQGNQQQLRRQQMQGSQPPRLVMMDVRTGLPVGGEVVYSRTGGGARSVARLEMIPTDGVVLIAAGTSLQAYRTKRLNAPDEEGL